MTTDLPSVLALICLANLLGCATPAVPLDPPENGGVRPFKIEVPEPDLDDLRSRLARVRWPDQLKGASWDYGTNLEYLKSLVAYWKDDYDWRAEEKALNEFPQFKTKIDGLDVHFLHVRSLEPNALPLVLNHGWPGTPFEFEEVIGPLTDPVAHGGGPRTPSMWFAPPCRATPSRSVRGTEGFPSGRSLKPWPS
jgi:hypothetical protein